MTCTIGKLVARASLTLAAAAFAALTYPGAPHATADTTQVPGMDVSGYQGNVDWPSAWAAGARFAYIKATEGTNYRNPYFAQQYNGSYGVGMIRGAYHFARPDVSDGPTQAGFFVAHGGGWSSDGKTLPPMLDIEYNPQGQTCFGLSQAAMVNWIRSFSEAVHAKTGRWPMLYTTTDWWKTCTGNSPAFGETHPLFIARYAGSPGPLPSGWRYYTMWQYSDSGAKPGDQDTFNGSMDQLIRFAGGDAARGTAATTTPRPTTAPPSPATTTPPKPTSTARNDARIEPAPTTPTTSTTTSTRETPVSPPSGTPVAPARPAKPISGLVWAGHANANPPQSLRVDKKDEELLARHYVANDEADAPRAGVAVSAAPQPVTSAAPHTEAAPAPLASTGASSNTARVAVFGATLLLLGTILVFLARIALRR